MENEISQINQALERCAHHTNFMTTAFCEGGFVMYLIGAVGVLAIFLIFERLIAFQRFSVDKNKLTKNLFSMILQGDVRQAIAFCDNKSAPLTNTLKSGLIQVLNQRPDEEVQVAMDATVIKENQKIEGYTQFLAVFGNVSVLTGLLGTIVGMLVSFGGVAEADAATKTAALARGISEALNCTAFGLLVAIISIIFYGIFQIRISHLIADLQETSMNLLNLVASNRDKLKK